MSYFEKVSCISVEDCLNLNRYFDLVRFDVKNKVIKDMTLWMKLKYTSVQQ